VGFFILAHMKKSWNEKLNCDKSHLIKKLDKNFSDMKEGDNMLIATPKIIDSYIKKIPKGIKIDIKTLRKDLALTYNTDTTCPVTTGIFLRIVSEAAYEDFLNGEKNITPFWRVVDHESKTASKLACGINFIKKRRREENII
jgi:hypothetical protein